jgi:hypothetical protein
MSNVDHIKSKLSLVKSVFEAFEARVSNLGDDERVTAGTLVEELAKQFSLPAPQLTQLIAVVGKDFPDVVQKPGRYGGFYKVNPNAPVSKKSVDDVAKEIAKEQKKLAKLQEKTNALRQQQATLTPVVSAVAVVDVVSDVVEDDVSEDVDDNFDDDDDVVI